MWIYKVLSFVWTLRAHELLHWRPTRGTRKNRRKESKIKIQKGKQTPPYCDVANGLHRDRALTIVNEVGELDETVRKISFGKIGPILLRRWNPAKKNSLDFLRVLILHSCDEKWRSFKQILLHCIACTDSNCMISLHCLFECIVFLPSINFVGFNLHKGSK